MAISNSGVGIRPGVCTSSTRPTAPYEGQTIYETDTDLTYVWGGSAWQQVSGGTAVGNSGLVYVKQQTVGSGVASVTVSDAFSTTYDNYRIIYAGGTASGQERFKINLGASVTGYYSGLLFLTYSGGGFGSAGTANATVFNFIGGSNTTGGGFVLDLQNPFLAQYTQMNAFGSLSLEQATWCQGIHAVATSYTSFIVTPTSGTMTGGTITVYGYRKA